jgi:hypothetical protein
MGCEYYYGCKYNCNNGIFFFADKIVTDIEEKSHQTAKQNEPVNAEVF